MISFDVTQNPEVTLVYPYFPVHPDLLYHVKKKQDKVVEQVVYSLVPYKDGVPHSHMLGGHLGLEKTKAD